MSVGRAFGVACAVAIVAAGPAPGQEQPATFEFSFSNPGARSLGLGGAFAALADDATAAFANPAGLVQLLEPEVSAEARTTARDTRFVEGGRVSGTPTGDGLDTTNGLRFGVDSSESTELSYLSLVFPAERWSFALYRHQWADFELASRIDGLFAVEDGEDERAGDITSRVGVHVVQTGAAAAVRLGDRWSVGAGVVYYDAELDSHAFEYTQDDDAFYEPSGFLAERLDTEYLHRARGSDFAFHAGILLRASPRWSFGAYFREGPRMTMRVLEIAGPVEEDSPEGALVLDATSPLELPDVYGAGVAFRSRDGAWTVSGEWSHVVYSSITRGLDVDVLDPRQVVLDDGDELHLGVEYVILRARPVVALRVGAWRDPAHRVLAGVDADAFERAVFDGGENEVHWAAGVGLVFARFQLDLGVDLSDETDTLSLSAVYRF